MKKGFHHSEETKRKISEHNACYWKGKTLSVEHRQKLSSVLKGRPSPLKGRKTGQPSPMKGKHPFARTAYIESHLGKCLTEEHKQHIGNALKGHKCSDSTRQKIRNALTGRYHTKESKLRISTGCKKSWNKRRMLVQY